MKTAVLFSAVCVLIFSKPLVLGGQSCNFSILAPSGVCGPPLTLQANNPNPISGWTYNYMWTIPNGNMITGEMIQATIPGIYTLTVMGMNGILTCSNTDNVTIFSTPNITINPANPVICNGQSIQVTASGGTTCNWCRVESNGVCTPIINACTLNPDAPGTYKVKVTGANNCSSELQITINAVQTPPVPTIVGPSSVCRGQQVIYHLMAPPVGNITWQLVNGGGNIVQTLTGNGAIVVRWGDQAGTFSVRVTQGSGMCERNFTHQVTVLNTTPTTQPASILYYPLNNIFIVKDSTADCYQWGYYEPSINMLINMPIKGETYQAYAAGEFYSVNRHYWVKTWRGNCDAEPACATVSYLRVQADSPFPEKEKFLLYPNPNDGGFRFIVKGLPEQSYFLVVSDGVGRKMLHKPLTASNGRIDEWVQLQQGGTGLYFAMLLDEKGTAYKSVPFIVLR